MSLTDLQKTELAKWVVFSVIFGFIAYLFGVFDVGFDGRKLFGDGSLILLGLGLVVAAGATVFDDGISELKQHWGWFGVIALVLVLGAGAYSTARRDLREVRESAPPIELADALVLNEQARRLGNGETPLALSSEEFDLLITTLDQLRTDLNAAAAGDDARRATVLQQDAVDRVVSELRIAEDALERESEERVAEAEKFAMLAGFMMIVAGLLIGSTVVLRVHK